MTTTTTTTTAAETDTLLLNNKRNRKRSRYRRANTPVKNISRSEKRRNWYKDNHSARLKISKAMHKHWDNPEWRKKMLAVFHSPEFRTAQSLKMKAVYKRKKALK